MATFIIKGNKRTGTITREVNGIVVGSRSSCTLSLEDPLVAEEHCAIVHDGKDFLVEDLGTSSGTYLNGIAVVGRVPVKDGAEIVIGVSRLKAVMTPEKPEVTLTLKEADFYFDKKEDPLRWSRTEVEFGRFKPLRVANLVTVAVLLLALPLAFIGRPREALMDAGPLWPAHRTDSPAFAAALATLPAGSQGCEACHTAFSGVTNDKCAACHSGYVGANRHPFAASAAGFGTACASCHVDHRGSGHDALIATPAPKTCTECHTTDELKRSTAAAAAPTSAAFSALVMMGRDGTPHPERAASRPRRAETVSFDAFPHAKHCGPNVREAIACATCHKATAPAAAPAAGPRREYPVVTFDVCNSCHAPGANGPVAVPDSKRFAVDWHGTRGTHQGSVAKCTQCHQAQTPAAGGAAAGTSAAGSSVASVSALLRTVTTTPADLRYDFAKSRAHADVTSADGTPGKDDCVRCHGGEEHRGSRKLENRPFLHGTHLTAGAPQEQCVSCHTEQMTPTADHLAAGFFEKRDGDCATCHRQKKDEPLLPTMRAPVARGAATTRPDFPHRLHVHPAATTSTGGSRPASPARFADVSKGCASCHQNTMPSSDAAFGTGIETAADVRNCRQCHDNHKDIGGGSCASCHTKDDPSFTGKPLSKMWPASENFSHTSRGHRPATDAGQCATCHVGAATAATIMSVPIPAGDDPSCIKCHAGEKARFHW